jgi:hypothetical protein
MPVGAKKSVLRISSTRHTPVVGVALWGARAYLAYIFRFEVSSRSMG